MWAFKEWLMCKRIECIVAINQIENMKLFTDLLNKLIDDFEYKSGNSDWVELKNKSDSLSVKVEDLLDFYKLKLAHHDKEIRELTENKEGKE